MKTSEEFANEFLSEIKAGKYKREILPDCGPELDEDFYERQMEVFDNLLKSDIGQIIMSL